MPEDQLCAGRLQAAQSVKHLQLGFAVKCVGRQGERLKRAPQVTGIAAEHELAAAVGPHEERLVPGGVPGRWQQEQPPIAEDIPFPVQKT